jgi:Predicted nucleic-acid-binding protein containing a Zn-ribbon
MSKIIILPPITHETKPFWEYARKHELRIPRCMDCKRHFFPPSSFCPYCLSENIEWVKSSSRGKVKSWIIVQDTPNSKWGEKVPDNVVLVELDEGPRLISQLIGIDNNSIKGDMEVEVFFEDITNEISLPKFKPINE